MRPAIHHPALLPALILLIAVDVIAVLALLLHQGFDVAAGVAWLFASVTTLLMLPVITLLSSRFLVQLRGTESGRYVGETIP